MGGRGWAGWSWVKGGKWDNCNSIINKHIFLKRRENETWRKEKTLGRINNLSRKRKLPLRYTRTRLLWKQVAAWRWTKIARTPILGKTKVPDHRRWLQAKVIKVFGVCCDFLVVFICCITYSVSGKWPQLLPSDWELVSQSDTMDFVFGSHSLTEV